MFSINALLGATRPLARCMACLLIIVLALIVGTAGAYAASVTTDKDDYPPGDSVIITGSGFWPGELVSVQIVHSDGDPVDGDGHDPWDVNVDGFGGFQTYWIVPYDDHVGEELLLTADGIISGLHAEHLFTDANTTLILTTTGFDTLCPGTTEEFCAVLEQPCGGGQSEPLAGRTILFFFNDAGCGNDVGQQSLDSATTDLNGVACVDLVVPTTPGSYQLRVKFRGEDKPSPCGTPGNSACDPNDPNPAKRCVKLSNANVCETVVVDSAACCQPPTITCPTDVTIACDASTDPGNTGQATATGTCTPITITSSDSEVAGSCLAEKTITRTWIATDVNGNADTCAQIITVEDNTNPTIACPADITVECAADVPAADIGSVTASDNCGSVTVTHEGDGALTGGTCGGTITRTYRATDECGNFVECQQTITVDDNTNPTIACPTDITVDCEANVPAADIGSVTATDNCGSVTVTHQGDGALTGGACGGTIIRTYRATDDCGNFVECQQTITVDDNTNPTIACPADITVDCIANVPAADIGSVTASDNCGNVTVTHQGDTPLAGGACGGTIVRTYRATDDCGNFVECQQTITVDDNTNPTIACPADVTVDCIANVPAADIGSVTATDNCGSVTVTHQGDGALTGGACGGTIIRTYRATDDCGNFVECQQTITVDDNTNPTIACPADVTVDCIANVPAADIGSVTATDNCGSVTVTHQGDGALTGGACGGTIIRTYRATDDCGNFVECQQTITVDDNTNPTIACPTDITVDCEANIPAADIGSVTASDNCGNVTVTHQGDAPLAGGACGGAILRTYRATDDCGNFVECQQTITVDDNTNPTIACPTDVTVNCVTDVPAADIGSVTASDNCGSVTVTHEGDSPLSGACPATITRTYRATDDCGNFVECQQTITVDDMTNPTIACPVDITVDCVADVPAADIGSVTASDNCGSVTVTHEGDAPLAGGACGGTIVRTYRATDDCGNFVECLQTITVDDNTNPTIACPADITVDCEANVPAADIGSVTASDDCGNVTVTHEGDAPLAGGACGGTIIRTYRATDDCGNFVECTQTITVDDNTNPTIACPVDITVDCEANVPAADIGSVTASDNCGNVTVTHQGDAPLAGGACGGTIVRTYRATDDCGNFVECQQTITVDDNTNPTIACPADVTVNCVADVPPSDIGSVTASDNCGSVTVTHEGDSPLSGSCPATITRTYRATDDCGNFVECQQTITVDDNTNPTIACPTDVTVNCVTDVPAADIGSVTASDNCGSVTVTHEGDSPLSGACPATITRTYRATDECGNFVECQQTITVDDMTNPTIACPVDITVDCVADVPAADIGSVTASDNCGSVTVTHEGDAPLAGGACGGTILRTYRATDDCGNFVECQQTITVDDNTNPTIACPTDIMVDCEANVPAADIGSVTAADNCGNVTVTHQGDAPLAGGACGGTILRTYRATDDCGNFVECQQTITVDDNTNPTIACPTDIMVDCEANVPAADIGSVTAADNCGNVTVTHQGDAPLAGGACGGTILRTYRATDDCGNFVECQQTITVDDNTNPTIACPTDIMVDCEANVPAADIGSVTAADNCGNVTVTHQGDAPLAGGACGGTILRTYRATDDCGNFVECQQTITVDDNTNPTIACPADITVNCVVDIPSSDIGSVTASDNCGNVTVTHEGDSPLSGACPATITRTYRATDDCGNFVECQQTITVDDNTNPTIACPADITVECAADVPAADIGSVTANDNCGSATVTHEGDAPLAGGACGGTIIRTYRATDDCGNFVECQQTITVDDNTNPTIACPADITVDCEADVPAADIGSVTASDNCGNVTVTHEGDAPLVGGACGGTILRTYRATDDCGNFVECQQTITVDDNTPPICSLPSNTSASVLCGTEELCLPVSASDDCGGNVTCTLDPASLGTLSGGQWCYTPSQAVNAWIVIHCEDECGNVCVDSFFVTIGCQTEPPPDSCLIEVSINGGVNVEALNDQVVTVPITIDYLASGLEVGGFDLLLCYDQTAISIVDVDKGTAIDDWEYFTYRHGAFGNCGGPCPSGIIRLVGIADLDNGPTNHPSESAFSPVGVLTELSFYVTADRNFIEQCIPITFCSFDCADNTISSRTGDTLYVDLFDFDPSCQNNPKYDPLPSICFDDGALCIQEPPDDRGDLNLNFIANEVGDAVLYSRYFIEGSSVWDPVWAASQILASDVNDDGVVLTVADLIYMIRIITGDAQAFPLDPGSPKLAPYTASANATLRMEDGRAVVSTTSDVELGGALLVFRYTDLQIEKPVLASDEAQLSVSSRAKNGELRVLISPETTGKSQAILAGAQDLINVPFDGSGSIELVEVQFSDAQGALLSSEIAKGAAIVPGSYALHQNYPNPFNAGTVISFDLKDASDWTLTIYNVTGQRVRTFGGSSEAARVAVEWDGTDNNGQSTASGVYFYNVKAGSFTDSRKMTLLK